MNSKAAIVSVVVVATGVIGAVAYFTNSNNTSLAKVSNTQSVPADGSIQPGSTSAYSSVDSTQAQQARSSQQASNNPKQAGHVIARPANQKSGWAAIMDRMHEFDADGDGILSDLEKMAMGVQLKKEWTEKYDTDGDGEISPEEMEAWQVEQFINSSWGQNMMRKFDADGDGILNPEEEVALRARLKQMEQEKQTNELNEFDTDGDGEISESEREVQREQQRRWWANATKSAVAEHDRDGDGELNIEESREAWNAWIQRQSIADFIKRYDADRDGSMGAGDYSEFIERYSAGDLAADVNRDGVINTLDLTAYTDLVSRSGD
jgi:Ca2+-binding EF-hand superfamily protein